MTLLIDDMFWKRVRPFDGTFVPRFQTFIYGRILNKAIQNDIFGRVLTVTPSMLPGWKFEGVDEDRHLKRIGYSSADGFTTVLSNDELSLLDDYMLPFKRIGVLLRGRFEGYSYTKISDELTPVSPDDWVQWFPLYPLY